MQTIEEATSEGRPAARPGLDLTGEAREGQKKKNDDGINGWLGRQVCEKRKTTATTTVTWLLV